MGIKTVPRPPNSPNLASCDFYLFPKLKGCRYETIEAMKEAVTKGQWHAHTRGLPWGVPEVVGTVKQVHCSRRRLRRRGLEFHVFTIKKVPIRKKVWKLIVCPSYMYKPDPVRVNEICQILWILKYKRISKSLSEN